LVAFAGILRKNEYMESLIEKKLDAVIQLCRMHHVAKLEVFGSAARGDFNESSDIDFLVEFDKEADPRRFDNFFELLRAFEQLFNRRVDLVEPGGLRNPYLIQRINQSRKEIYVAA
jgi:hypothetical protein